MERYLNRGGDSGVIGYEIGPDYIQVQFRDGSIYLYTNGSAGSANIAKMKELAVNGHGLNGYINRFVKYGYARKIR